MIMVISVFLKIGDDISLKYNSAKTFFIEFKLHRINYLFRN